MNQIKAFLTSVLILIPLVSSAQNTVDVTFRYIPTDNSIRSFVPGSFNDWGNNTNGAISSSDGSLLIVDKENGFSYQVVSLTIGGGDGNYQGISGYHYKFHEHYNQSGTNFQWFTDPINPISTGSDNNSFVEVTHPMIFQVEPISNSVQRKAPPLRANVASRADDPIDTSASRILVNGSDVGSFEEYYKSDLQLLLVPSFDDLGVLLTIGSNTIEILAITESGQSRSQTISFTYIATPKVTEEPRPEGLEDGITYHLEDPSSVSFSLFAPGKEFVYIIGDHSNWQAQETFLMKRDEIRADSVHYWITIDNFVPGETYRFQYLIDGEIRIADLFSELVLHPTLDRYISESVYPNRPVYPSGLTSNIVSVIDPGKAIYEWKISDFERPPVEEMVIYELLLRDFVEESSFEVLRDTLGYLQNLGVNVIELMPVSEFDGNLSWGYNPVFHGALDKSYGTRRAFKQFVDEAHRQGIAVVLDVVYNHAHDNSPLIQTFGTNRSDSYDTGNPLLGPGHEFNVFYHLNHDQAYIQYWLDRMNRYWLETYRVDGYRFDLTKGFASNVNNINLLNGYNPRRIENLKRMFDAIREVDKSAYVILEHFAGNSEERELEEYGMLLWGNHNFNYAEAVMGYHDQNKSNMSGIYFGNRNFTNPHLIGYMESHDEQWIMHKARAFGNKSGQHDVGNLDIALQRMKLAGVFFFTVPGPKMLWQFGELGYGWGSGECLKPGDGGNGDCDQLDPGRTSEKPIRWNYYEQENRYRLYRSWGELIRLRQSSPVFTSGDTDFRSSMSGVAKWIILNHEDMDVVIVGNFGVEKKDLTVQFSNGGPWYEFVTGTSEEFVAGPIHFTLSPAEFRIYTSRRVEPASPDVFFAVGSDGFSILPVDFELKLNYPNPFTASTTLTYEVPRISPVEINVYDLLGRVVASLVKTNFHNPGTFTIEMDGRSLSSGIYLARLTSGNRSIIQKMTLVK